MDFCVLVKISKRTISFWYQAEENLYAPLIINDTNIIPLCFYVNGNDFVFGNSAKTLFYSNDPNAFGNYFDIIKDPSKHFVFYGIKKPVKQLLYYGIEQYLSFFINTVLYKSDSIESYRQNFPLRFYFETDIEDKEKSLIVNIFTEAGYDNIESIDFKYSLFETLQNQKVVNLNRNILLLSGIDNTLYLELFRASSWELLKNIKLEGLGADPRVKILAEMIIDYVTVQNPHLNLDKKTEIGHILPSVAGLLENYTPILKGEIELMDGNKYWFTIKSRNLDERLLYTNTDSQIYSAIDELLKSSGISVDNTILLLGSEEISTPFFSTRLLKKYSSVISLKNSIFDESLKLIFSKISSNGYKSSKKVSAPPPIPNPGLNKTAPATNANSQSKEKATQIPPLPQVKAHSPPSVPMIDKSESEEKKASPVPPKIPSLKNESGEKKNVGTPIVPTIPKIPEFSKGVEEKSKVGIPPLPPLPQKK